MTLATTGETDLSKLSLVQVHPLPFFGALIAAFL